MRLVAGVSEPWLQAHPSDPVELHFPLLVRKKLLHRITRYHHPEQRSRRYLLPHAFTTVTHSFLEMSWSVSELERAPNMPHRRHGLHFSVYAGVCGMWATEYPRMHPDRRAKPGQSSPENACACWREIDYIQINSFSVVLCYLLNAHNPNFEFPHVQHNPFFSLVTY